jgi:L-ascorbate oxidase
MPSSLLWYHAHVHGIALEQLSHGLAGILTIGKIGDNVAGDASGTPFAEDNVRYMMLKDIQILAASTPTNPGIDFKGGAGPVPVVDGEVYGHTDSSFCNQYPLTGDLPRYGSCPGVPGAANDYTGGVWYFTINGVQYPTIPITKPDGEIWRIASGTGSLSWNLQLVNDQTQQKMIVQLIAIDGIAVTLPQDTPMGATVAMAGGRGRFHVVPCPNVTGITTVPVCVDEWVMMPSSRVDMYVTYRNANGVVAPAPAGATATLTMAGLSMGSGDAWPSVNMAKVLFNQAGPRQFTANAVVASDSGLMQPGGLFVSANPTAKPAPLPPGCTPLAPGHRRRIFFGFQDTAINNTFALAYEEVDQNGKVVPGTHYPAVDMDENNAAAMPPPPGFPTTTGLEEFDPNVTVICLPLAVGQMPATETWELVQLSTENHNFHLHKTRFIEKVGPDAGNVIQDNFPLGVAVPTNATIANQVSNNQNGVCTIPQWRDGSCASTAVVEQIPFTQLGEFVYHCHILEHEDGGMMARIVVVPSPN